jgi:tRNA(Ile)-lysidine synthase
VSLPIALQRRFLRWGIRKIKGDLTDISFDAIERILNQQACDFTTYLPNGIRANQVGQKITLSVVPPSPPLPSAFEIPLEPSEITIPQWGIEISMRMENRDALPFSFPKKTDNHDSAVFDLDKISPPIRIRGWIPGDRFVPFGMKGRHKKVHDFFMDMKIPKSKRDRIPLLVCPQGILWVMGYRTDESFRVTEGTRNILRMDMRIV